LNWHAVFIATVKPPMRDFPAELLATGFVIVTRNAKRRELIQWRERIIARTDREEMIDRDGGYNKLTF
jgi:hypothetical protein